MQIRTEIQSQDYKMQPDYKVFNPIQAFLNENLQFTH